MDYSKIIARYMARSAIGIQLVVYFLTSQSPDLVAILANHHNHSITKFPHSVFYFLFQCFHNLLKWEKDVGNNIKSDCMSSFGQSKDTTVEPPKQQTSWCMPLCLLFRGCSLGGVVIHSLYIYIYCKGLVTPRSRMFGPLARSKIRMMHGLPLKQQ